MSGQELGESAVLDVHIRSSGVLVGGLWEPSESDLEWALCQAAALPVFLDSRPDLTAFSAVFESRKSA